MAYLPPGAIPQAPITDTECHAYQCLFFIQGTRSQPSASLYDLLPADQISNGIDFMIMIAEAMN